jgi:microcystin-dependent protein
MPVTLPVVLVNGVVPVAEDFMANFNALKIAYDALENTGTVIPAGIVKGFAGTVVPTGWLNCDGAAVSRSGYSGLFAAIGTTWGVGDGATTFNLPDLRGRTLVGAGVGTGLSARTLAALFGTETHVLTSAQIPSHTHGIPNQGPLGFAAGSDSVTFSGAGYATNFGTVFDGALSGAPGGQAHPNTQPSAVIQWVIKT